MKSKGRIIVSNNGIIIVPYNKGESRALERQTSTFDAVYHNYKEVTGFILEYEGQTAFITHKNSMDYIQSQFPYHQIVYMNEVNPTIMSHEFALDTDITPTDIQYNIINQILNSKSNINNMKEWFVHLQTGYGKTVLSVYLSSIFNYKTLIMCFSSDILRQWVATMRKKTSFDMSKLLLIDSSKILVGIIEGTFDYERYDVFLCTPRLLTSFGKKYGYEKLTQVIDMLGIGFKIFDEAHRNIANIVKINATTNVKHTLYLSADFGQANEELEKKYFRIFYNVPIIKPSEEFEVSMKYTNAIVVEYNSKPDSIEKVSIFDSYGYNSEYYMGYQFRKKTIFKVVEYILKNIFNNYDGYRILLLLSHIDHVDKMTEYIEELYGDRYWIGRFHSKVPLEEKEITKSDATIIVSTYSSFGTGIDVSDIKYVVSLNQSNKIEDNQAAGRARPMADGSDVLYFMVMDKGFKYCSDKLRSRLSYLKDTKIKKVLRIKYR